MSIKQIVTSGIVAALCWSPTLAAKVMLITNEADYTTHVLNAKRPVVVKFSAEWCGVCQHVQQPFNEISEEDEFKNIFFAHVDIEKTKALGQQQKIIGVPTFVFLDQGKQKDMSMGVKNMDQFKDDFRKSLRTNFDHASLATAIDAPRSAQQSAGEIAAPIMVEQTSAPSSLSTAEMPIDMDQPNEPEMVSTPTSQPTMHIQEGPHHEEIIAAAPAQPTEMPQPEQEGIIARIINGIKEMFSYIIQFIKGLFA